WTNLYLLLLGDFEAGDLVDADTHVTIETDSHIIRTGFVKDTAPYYHVMDVFVLPTYREGFPNVVLEAQASCVPVVTTTATGAIESIVDGITGFLVPVGRSIPLAKTIDQLLKDRGLRVRMGQAG